MATSPLTLYRRFLATQEAETEEAACRALRRTLRLSRDRWPADLRLLFEAAGVSPGYVTRHLLSIGAFSPDVLAALEAGLPLAVCRLVNGLDSPDDRDEALASFWREVRSAAASETALLPRGLARQVERSARRLRSLQAVRRRAEDATAAVTEGWLVPSGVPDAARRPAGDAWIYPAPSHAARAAESLPTVLVEWLIGRYLAPGDRLVDVTAGAGTVGLIASRFGIGSWSGDLTPGAAFVHRVDARELLLNAGQCLAGAAEDSPGPVSQASRPAAGSVQALVLHPPTYQAWLDSLSADTRELATIEEYSDEVAAMLAGSIGVLAEGGSAIMITRPVRERGRVSLVTSHLSQVIVEFGMDFAGYHVAVADDGSEDWHVLVGARRREAA